MHILKLNSKGFSHHLLILLIPILAIGAIGAYVLSKSKADGGFVCQVGPARTIKVNNVDTQWYDLVIQNRSGAATASLSDINLEGQATSSKFTWNAGNASQKDYFLWYTGFSGASILNYGTVKGAVRKPVTPAGVDQGDWTLKIGATTAKCATTTNATTAFNTLVAEAEKLKNPTSANPAPAVTLPTYACTNLKQVSAGKFTVTIKNTSNQIMDFSKFKFRTGSTGPTPALSVDTDARGPINPGASLNAAFSGNASVDAGWYGAYVYDATNTVRVTCVKETTVSPQPIPTPAPTQGTPAFTCTNMHVIGGGATGQYNMVATFKNTGTAPLAVSKLQFIDNTGAKSSKISLYDGVGAGANSEIAAGATKEMGYTQTGDKATSWKLVYDGKTTVNCTFTSPIVYIPPASTLPLICEGMFPTVLKLGDPVSVGVQFNLANKTKPSPAASYKAAVSTLVSGGTQEQKYESALVAAVPANTATGPLMTTTLMPYSKTVGKTVTLYAQLKTADNKVTYPCAKNGYVTYNLDSGAKVDTPSNLKPVDPGKVVSAPPAGQETPTPGNTNKNVADLGYRPEMVCVKKVGAKYEPGVCNEQSTGILLTVLGENQTSVPKNKITYQIEPVNMALSKKYKFKIAKTCGPRSLVTGDKLGQGSDSTVLDCTVYYSKKDDGFLGGMRQSVINRFKRIFKATSADTYLSNSEANAAMDQIYRQSDFKEGFKITMKYNNYKPQVVNNYKLQFDYAIDANDYVNRINQINCQSSDAFTCGIIMPL